MPAFVYATSAVVTVAIIVCLVGFYFLGVTQGLNGCMDAEKKNLRGKTDIEKDIKSNYSGGIAGVVIGVVLGLGGIGAYYYFLNNSKVVKAVAAAVAA